MSRPDSGDGHRRRSERSTDALLSAAAELAAEGGLGAMTFAAIGERAGYSRGLVTARFGSKASLVDAMIRRAWQQLRIFEVLDEHRGPDGLSQVLDLLEAFRVETRRDPVGMRALLVLLFEGAVGTDEMLYRRVLQFHHAMVDELAAVIARGVADGSVRPDRDPRAEALHIVSAVRGLGFLWVLDPDGFGAEDAGRHLREVVVDRLVPSSRGGSGARLPR